jgi:hypothetical protein
MGHVLFVTSIHLPHSEDGRALKRPRTSLNLNNFVRILLPIILTFFHRIDSGFGFAIFDEFLADTLKLGEGKGGLKWFNA